MLNKAEDTDSHDPAVPSLGARPAEAHAPVLRQTGIRMLRVASFAMASNWKEPDVC